MDFEFENSEQALLSKEGSYPLLPNSADEKGEKEKESNVGSSTASAVFNLTTTIIGAGIMGLPSKMKVLGLPIGLSMLIAMGFLTECSIEMLLFCSIATNAGSYMDVMSKTNGKVGRNVMTFSLILNNVGVLVIYLIIIGDVLSGSGSDSPGVLVTWAGGSVWWNSRACVLTTTVLFIITPLVAFEKVDSLQFSSAISILLAIVFVIITVFLFLLKLLNGTINFDEITIIPQFNSWDDIIDIFSVIPTMCTAYVCHYNVHPIYAELAHPKEKNMKLAVRYSLSLCTFVYCVTALSGYMLFGEDTMSDVLSNFNSDLGVANGEVIADIVRICYALHLMLVFPVIHFSLRMTVDNVFFSQSLSLQDDKKRYFLLTVTLLAIILCGAVFIPSIEFAFDFTGSLAAVTLAFTLPGLAAWRVYSHREFKFALPVLFVVIGIVVSITGIFNSIWSVIYD